ncbi:hypothetical protein Taro_041235 [Colocasia esculenta]|uniref:Uncharacterized protein n=1 Tax=Colocasia esculenta TaxID=4460 RepID=A0A843X039_COLES|nr:hypothetical protein [Colocasia esculenta]
MLRAWMLIRSCCGWVRPRPAHPYGFSGFPAALVGLRVSPRSGGWLHFLVPCGLCQMVVCCAWRHLSSFGVWPSPPMVVGAVPRVVHF